MKSKSTQKVSGKDKAKVVFTQFSSCYRQKWNSTFKTDDEFNSCVEIWGQELEVIPIHQIQFAIKQLRKEYDEWPPNMFEFLRLCAGMTLGAINRQARPQITYLGVEGAWNVAKDELDDSAMKDPSALFKKLQPGEARKALCVDSTNVLDFKS